MIRPAVIDDLPALLRLAELMHSESRFAGRYPFDHYKARELLDTAIWHPAWVVWVAEKDGELVGGLVGTISEQWFSRELVVQDLAVFVKPDARGGFIAARMVRLFHEWAVDRGAVDCEIGVNTGVHPERTGELLKAAGFEQVGQLYSKRANECVSPQ